MSAYKKTTVGVIGATGFTGEKLVELLLGHHYVKITYLSAVLDDERGFGDVFSKFKDRLSLTCKNLNLKEAAEKADVIFLALPHKISQEIAPFFLKKKKTVIDLSADYRLKDAKVYKQFYNITHSDVSNIKKAVYGLPEFYRGRIAKAKLIANPGCYPTVSILSIAPLLREGLLKNIIIDDKSGITGAGRKASLAYHYAHRSRSRFRRSTFLILPGIRLRCVLHRMLSRLSGAF